MASGGHSSLAVSQVRRSAYHDLSTAVVQISESEIVLDPESIQYDDVLNPLNELSEFLEELVQEALETCYQKLNVQIGSLQRIGVSVRGATAQGTEVTIYLPFRAPASTTQLAREVLSAISNKLNSAESLVLDLEVVMSLQPAPSLNNIQGSRSKKLHFTGDMNQFLFHKRALVQINPEGDEVNQSKDCFYQLVGLGLARLISKNLLSPLPELNLDHKSYRRMTSSRSKFQLRHEVSKKLKERFHLDHLDRDVISEVERYFQIHIVLFSYRHFRVEYPPVRCLPYPDEKPEIFGLLLEEDQQGDWKHVDFISNPCAFYATGSHAPVRLCHHCFQLYPRKRGCALQGCQEESVSKCSVCHTCKGTCATCKTNECGYGGIILDDGCHPYPAPEKCRACSHVFFSPRCRSLHALVCKALFWKKCELCGRNDHRGLKCDETRCMMCNEVLSYDQRDQHQCWLRREKLHPVKTQYIVYDFECCIDEQENQRHVPYLCTAWFPFGHEAMRELESLFPSQSVETEEGNPVFVFWGLGDPHQQTGVYEFFKFVTHPLVSGHILFAHNARAYDSILVQCYMSKYLHLFSINVQRGQKMLSMRYDELDIEFRDSLCFIPTSLRAMSSDFGIEELKKGHFPHKVVTRSYLQEAQVRGWKMPKPSRDMFPQDTSMTRSGEKEFIELNAWLDKYYQTGGVEWDVRQEAIEYCISDTVLLGKTLVSFRQQLMEITSSICRPEDVTDICELDPLSYITLPSAMMSFYMSQMLPQETIGVIDRFENTCLKQAELWILWIEHELGRPLERRVLMGRHVVHAFDAETQTAYRFLDCYESGCLECYMGWSHNRRSWLTFQQCNDLTQSIERELLEHCQQVIHIWKHEWEEEYESNILLRQWFLVNYEYIESQLPLDPRDAYKGGKVEVYKLSCPGEIEMVDFVSQYPTTLLGESFDPFSEHGVLDWPMPIGQPKTWFHPTDYSLNHDRLGIAKCIVLCPSSLYVPFLGYKVQSRLNDQSYEVLYGNCRTCMQTRCDTCTHTEDQDRSFVGTWTLSELRYALTLGYQICQFIEVWEYEQSDKLLFRPFIVPFMVEKILSKKEGLVTSTGEFTDQGNKMAEYVFQLSGRQVTPSDFKHCPARRTVAKLAQNSFTGKWGESEVRRSTRTFNESQCEESRKLLTDPNIEIVFAQVLDDEGKLAVIEYEPKLASSRTSRRKNDIIVSHITAYGRIMLNRLEQRLADRQALCYVDTDSAFHARIEPCYFPGYRTGDLEPELKDGKQWVCCGRKWYTYSKPGGVVCKLKGFTLRRSMASLFTPETMYKHIIESKKALQEYKEQNDVFRVREFNQTAPSIEVTQLLFKTSKENAVVRYKQSIAMQKRAQFQIGALKRWALFPPQADAEVVEINTFPYGYRL